MQARLEHVPINERHSFFAAEHRIRERLDHPFHLHPEVEIAVVHGLNGTLQCGATTSSFESGQLFVLGPSVPHRFTGRLSPGACGRATVIQFRPDWLGERFNSLPEARGYAALVDRSRLGLTLRDPDERIRAALSAVPAAAGFSRLVCLLSLIAAMLESARFTEIAGSPLSLKRETRDIARIQRLQDTLREKFREEVSESSIADLLGFTRTSFCRWVRSVTGRTFTEILNDHRITHAVLLLRQTNLPVSAVALESGYRSLSHFYREFRKRHEGEPSGFRLGE